jgi:competence ComEA-like helix-hairpin-helix protein
MHYIPVMILPHFLYRPLVLAACLVFLFSASPLGAKKKPPEKPVNLNTATSEQLQQVPGIGPATADKILKMRKSYGPFKSVDDLLAIRGLGPKRLEKMRKYLTTGKSAAPKPASQAARPTTKPPPSTEQPPDKP